jgi:hypothetical protein
MQILYVVKSSELYVSHAIVFNLTPFIGTSLTAPNNYCKISMRASTSAHDLLSYAQFSLRNVTYSSISEYHILPSIPSFRTSSSGNSTVFWRLSTKTPARESQNPADHPDKLKADEVEEAEWRIIISCKLRQAVSTISRNIRLCRSMMPSLCESSRSISP